MVQIERLLLLDVVEIVLRIYHFIIIQPDRQTDRDNQDTIDSLVFFSSHISFSCSTTVTCEHV
jgi:hypothetical protein